MQRINIFVVVLVFLVSFSNFTNIAQGDESLIRQYEPILYLHPDDEYMPMDVDSYVKQCSLWAVLSETLDMPIEEGSEGNLTVDLLASISKEAGDLSENLYLKFVEEHKKVSNPRDQGEFVKRNQDAVAEYNTYISCNESRY